MPFSPGVSQSASAFTLLVALLSHAPTTLRAQAPDTVELAEVRIIGQRSDLSRVPGSAFVLDRSVLQRWHPSTIDDILRGVPGVVVRSEEGLGLRPNIAVRGLNPTRSTKVLLLEDGVPITFAPYGANETYYHPPIERFDRIEVLKGSGQILFGPQTIGGVINYLTPPVPRAPTLTVALTPGSRDYLNARVAAGGTRGPAGALLSYDRKQGEGARANVGSRLDDLTLKSTLSFSPRHALTVRGNAYRERSNVTYSGLTEAEWAIDPRQNPFQNDSMLLDRWGASATHSAGLGAATLTTTAYAYGVSRDWWRQSSNSAERPNDRSDPRCGGMTNLSTTCGNQGRVRDYLVWGAEPRVQARLGPLVTLQGGLRLQGERQDRRQINGASPHARTAGPADDVNAGLLEDNLRENLAYAAFLQPRLFLGRWTLTPGVRIEHVRYDRRNRLADPETSGHTTLTQVVPGLGVTFNPSNALTVFTGVHRGFAPPRTEDMLTNAGGVVDLDAELSWNYEVGARAAAGAWNLEATAFSLDFENQIIPASVAGGTGAALTSAGRTLHQGLELAGRLDGGRLVGSPHNVFLAGALTWLPIARFEGPRYVYLGTGDGDAIGKVYAGQNGVGTRRQVSVTDNRLPYAPKATLAITLGYAFRETLDARVETVVHGGQFGDAFNTGTLVPDGQQGPVPGYTVWNAAATYRLGRTRTTLFVAGTNLTDRLYIADRTRGLLPGAPRSIRAGLAQTW